MALETDQRGDEEMGTLKKGTEFQLKVLLSKINRNVFSQCPLLTGKPSDLLTNNPIRQ